MIDWLKLISSGLMDSLIQVSILIFSSFSVRRGLDLSPKSPNAYPRLRAQYHLLELVTKWLDTHLK